MGAGRAARGGLWARASHLHCSGGREGRGISARTACGSVDLVFSSTTFSGIRSAGHRRTQAGGPRALGPEVPALTPSLGLGVPPACGPHTGAG